MYGKFNTTNRNVKEKKILLILEIGYLLVNILGASSYSFDDGKLFYSRILRLGSR